ncbi:restriction endonuclease [Saccharopolyspora sp. NPDC047091]|uniref:restriction endonuclease n=1 Tax=Saccharopolyspora sp. NPDC047091 TaxID=3155924 RepID=UPI0033EB9A24
MDTAYRGDGEHRIRNFTAQLWTLRGVMEVGDLMVMPMKSTSQIAIGRIKGDYRYRADEPDAEFRHVRPVEWNITDLPRTVIKQDLLHSLGAFMTICGISRNDAARRLEQVAERGVDPGARVRPIQREVGKNPTGSPAAADDSDADDVGLDVERYARDQIAARVIEIFSGHRLAELVAALLEAEGFVCRVSPAGPDQGVDIVAGMGPFGLDSPKVVVQVKSELGAVGDGVVQQLEGVVSRQGADQGLLVAWGGVTGAAQREMNSRRFVLRAWNSENVLEAVFRHYRKLPADIQAELPLKQVWTLVDETG